jgi:hypothetical protein
MVEGRRSGLCAAALVAAALLAAAGTARADDVKAKRKGATLVLKGDADGNHFRITDTGSGTHVGSKIVVTPLDATTVNGDPGALEFDDVVHLKISLGDGNDTLELTAVVEGNLKIAAGPGDDTLLISGADIDGNVAIAGAAGALTLDMSTVEVDRSLVVRGGPGNDTVTCSAVDVDFNGVFALGAGTNSFTDTNGLYDHFFSGAGGPGADTFSFTDSYLQAARFQLGPGANALSMTSMDVGTDMTYAGGPQDDLVTLLGAHIGENAAFKLSGGDNRVTLDLYDEDPQQPGTERTQVGEFFTVAAGSGDDTIALGGATQIGESTRLTLASGDNTCNLLDTSFGEDLFVSAGSGDDSVDVTGSGIGGDATYKLGGGVNTQP